MFEYTSDYALDAKVDAVDFMLDLNCIAVTLMSFCWSAFDSSVRRTRTGLLSIVNQMEREGLLDAFFASAIRICLKSNNCIEANKSYFELNGTFGHN